MTRAPCLVLVAALVGCGGDDSSSTEPLGGSLTVTGDVHDFQSGAVLDVAAMVSTTAPRKRSAVGGSSRATLSIVRAALARARCSQ